MTSLSVKPPVEGRLFGPPAPSGRPRDLVVERLVEAANHYREPVSRSGPSLEHRFKELVSQWKEATAYLSSSSQLAMHPAYQQIIGMGPQAVPFLLRELRVEPYQWFWALKAITGVDPVPPSSAGRVREMADCWLRWGHEEGLL